MQLEVYGRTLSVFRDGTVRNERGKLMSQYVRKSGYKYILLGTKPRRKLLVHRLIASAFIDNPYGLQQVNHKDGNKQNNCIENLEWVTGSENQLHSRYELGNQTGFKDAPVICIETQAKYKSTRDAWRSTGINYCHISECANGKRKTAGGYHWERG